MDTVSLIFLAALPALAIIAGLKDLTSMKIPNWISGLMVLAFFPAALAVGLDPMTAVVNVAIAALALVVGAGMFALRWIGGGDAKFMAAACLWLGLSGSGMFLLWTGVVGGVFCLALLFARFHSRPYLLGAPGWVVQLMEPRGDIPYGVAIAAGALMAYPGSPLLAAFIAG
ncbi:MAG: prepilin peptidase [Brevundimonas sp.]